MLRPDSPRHEDTPSTTEAGLRRRLGTLGVILAGFMVLTTSVVVFAMCACKTTR
jgi:hypothetical protein